MEGARYKQILE